MTIARISLDQILMTATTVRYPISDPVADLTLVQSFRDYGQLEPILVRRLANDRYILTSGRRRVMAAQACGHTHIIARVEPMPECGFKEHANVWVVMTNDDYDSAEPNAVFTRKEDAQRFSSKLEADGTSMSVYEIRFNPKEPDFEVGEYREALVKIGKWDTPKIYNPKTRRIYKEKQGVFKGHQDYLLIWCFGTLADLVNQIVAVRDLLLHNKEVKYVKYEDTRTTDSA